MTIPGQSKESFRTPKGCIVARARITPKGVEVGWRCAGDTGGGDYPSPSGGRGNYPSALVRGARAIDVHGARISGVGAHIGFPLGTRYARCHTTARADAFARTAALICEIFNERGKELSGARARRKKRR